MTNSASAQCDPAGEFADVFINGEFTFRVFGTTSCSRASSAASALNAAFVAGDDFEFCTPSFFDSSRPYAVITVKSAKASVPSTWYAHDKRLIVAATADDSSYPWWTALTWAKAIRNVIPQTVTILRLPANKGTINDGSAFTSKKGSNYGNGEGGLNRNTSNGEFFHTCDLTVAVNVWTVPYGQSRWVRVTYPEAGKTAILRVNDYGPAISTHRSIDFSFWGSSYAIGNPTYLTDHLIDFQFRK